MPDRVCFTKKCRGERKRERKREKNIKELLGVKDKSDRIRKLLRSPGTEIEETLLALIFHEKKEIKIAVYVLSLPSIVTALIAARKRKVTVSVVVDKEQCGNTAVLKLHEGGINDVCIFSNGRSMHTKLAIFSKNVCRKSVGWLGSANFSAAGFSSNQDNVWVSNDEYFVK